MILIDNLRPHRFLYNRYFQPNEAIQTVAIPGLCTGCGRMPFHIASNQMFLAYDEIINRNYKQYETFGDAQKYQYRLNEKGLIWDY